MTNNLKMVDELGRLLAQIAELNKQADAIKDALRAEGPGAYEGQLFRATVSEAGTRVVYDGEALYNKLREEGFHAFAKRHRHEIATQPMVRVVSKTGRQAAA